MELKEYILTGKFKPYDDKEKQIFKKLGTKFMYDLAKENKFIIKSKHSYNKAGIAVSGDHSMVMEFPDNKFANVMFDADFPHLGILYRTMKHEKDYTGGGNNWCKWGDADKLNERINNLVMKGG